MKAAHLLWKRVKSQIFKATFAKITPGRRVSEAFRQGCLNVTAMFKEMAAGKVCLQRHLDICRE